MNKELIDIKECFTTFQIEKSDNGVFLHDFSGGWQTIPITIAEFEAMKLKAINIHHFIMNLSDERWEEVV